MKLARLILCFCVFASLIPSYLFAKSEMVEIAVEITEINNTKANDLGIKWTDTMQVGQVANTVSGRVPTTMPEPIGNFPSLIKVGDWAQYTSLTAELKLLQEMGAAQILSKPKILTKSGTSAKVIVGGEIPIVATGNIGGSIEWKEYGIKVEITPQIIGEEMIDIALNTEVSRLDYTKMSGGYPSIVKREAKSFVKVKSGQTITIAGLIETDKENVSSGIPLLCDIPVFGVLFSRKTTIEKKTNVMIFVTPRIIEQ
ncbi:MAG: type II and III secretion system protein [Elusimicrobia bacterium]|nr:type II and III secretion system protein [Elusimicrobiota bacterium]